MLAKVDVTEEKLVWYFQPTVCTHLVHESISLSASFPACCFYKRTPLLFWISVQSGKRLTIQSGCLSGTCSTWKASLRGPNPEALTQENLPRASKSVLEEWVKHEFSVSKKQALRRNHHHCAETRLSWEDRLGYELPTELQMAEWFPRILFRIFCSNNG